MRNILHEESLVRAFFLPGRQKRALIQLACVRKRSQLLNRLSRLGFDFLDENFVGVIDEDIRDVNSLYALLKSKGASKDCYLISRCKEFDYKEMPLFEALMKVWDSQQGTILSIIPGKLAYYEGEKPGIRYILFNPAKPDN